MALPNIIQQINSKIPLSGGKITGCLFLNNPDYSYLCARTTNDNDVIVCGGSNMSSGSTLRVCGINRSTLGGTFILTATDGTNNKQLIGYPNRTLTWDGNNVITSAGGTMNNTITCSSSYTVALQKENANSMLTLRSSNDWNGGCIHLWGGNNSGNYPGEVEIIPRTVDSDGTSHHTVFRFRKDGTIERGSTPINFVVTSWSSGANWYRIWSNGWIEQGGSIPSGGTSSWRTLTFSKAFSNTNYSIVVTCSNVSDISYWASSYTKTASSVKVGTCNYIGTKSFYGVDWYACGY